MEKSPKTLPNELIEQILVRLPVRSVVRSKCVCKSWRSLISNPQFAKSHFDLAAAPSHRILLRSTHFYLESIDIDASLHHDSAVAFHPLPLPSPPSPRRREYTIDRSLEHHDILGSSRGLVLLAYYNGDLILWNPSTADYKRTSNPCPDLTCRSLYGFVYDAALDDYLLYAVELYGSDIFAFDQPIRVAFISLKTNTCTFVAVDGDVRYKDLGFEFRAGSLLNGALHWLVFCKFRKIPLIITVDLVDKTLSEILLPHELTDGIVYELYSLRLMGGCLTVGCTVKGVGIDELWVMKEYKVHSSWTKSITILTFDISNNHFSPIHVAKDGIFGSNFSGLLEKVNHEGEVLEHLPYRRTKGCHGGNLQSAMYVESLLPVPSVMKVNGNYDDDDSEE
ncbi:hypothetical protein RJT34_18454 [Clitoria ternatea]|uniref:F-box domain-containing protein n=1 Tax=Clitoria ternatea TaxID=43366 RepID=A0AAN9JC47_CLITE